MLFESIIVSVDDTIANYVIAAHETFSGPVETTLRLIIIAYIAWYGISIHLQIATLTIYEVVGRVLLIAAVHAFVTSWAWYVVFIYNFFLGGAEGIGVVLLTSADLPIARETIHTSIGLVWDIGMTTASELRKQAGMTNLGPLFYSLIVFIGTLMMTGYALFLLILSRLALAILFAIGPIFFLMIFFQSTRGFFEGWVRMLLNFSIVTVLLYAMIALLLSMFADVFIALQTATDNKALSLSQIAPFLLICFISLLLFIQIPAIAGGLTLSPGLQGTGFVGRQVTRAGDWTRRRTVAGSFGFYDWGKGQISAARNNLGEFLKNNKPGGER